MILSIDDDVKSVSIPLFREAKRMKNPKNYLKKFRTKQGLSQARIAALTGLQPATISRIETSVIRPNQEYKRKIARVLKAKAEDVFPKG
jgi:DNA-binding XRE family transcriptional regulator